MLLLPLPVSLPLASALIPAPHTAESLLIYYLLPPRPPHPHPQAYQLPCSPNSQCMPPPAPAQDHQSPRATDTDAVSLSLSRYMPPSSPSSSLLLGEEMEEERKLFPSLLSLRLLRNLTGAQISSANGYISMGAACSASCGGGRGGEGGRGAIYLAYRSHNDHRRKRLRHYSFQAPSFPCGYGEGSERMSLSDTGEKFVTCQYHQPIDQGRALLSGLDDVCGSCIPLRPCGVLSLQRGACDGSLSALSAGKGKGGGLVSSLP